MITSMDITIYTTPNCMQCEQTKKMFARKNVEFNLIDLTEDPIAKEMVKEMGYTSAPVVVASDRNWSGFKYDKIEALINEVQAIKAHA